MSSSGEGLFSIIACEGAGELPVRLEALSMVEHGGRVLPIYYCDAGIRLLDPTSVASIIATGKQVDTDAQRDHKLPLVLVIIDTVISAAAFAKSGDENDSASTVAGTSRASALAVFMLMTSSYLVGACTGRSAGFSPLWMR